MRVRSVILGRRSVTATGAVVTDMDISSRLTAADHTAVALRAIADRHEVTLVDDACHGIGGSYGGIKVGSCSHADVSILSFHPVKHITTAEGGMITTNDPALAERLRLLRSHGMTVSSWDRDKGRPAYYDVVALGYNFRFDDIRAALGLAQLAKLQQFNQKRAELVQRYNERFTEADLGLMLPFASVHQSKQPSYHIYPVVFRDTGERAIAEILKGEGIQTSVHYPPIHKFSAFASLRQACHLPVTEAFASRELTLPLYPSLSLEQVDQIAETVIPLLAGGCLKTTADRH